MLERKRRWRVVIGLVVGLVIVGLYVLSPRLLYADSPRERADVIIILGGDAEGRVKGVSPIIEESSPGSALAS